MSFNPDPQKQAVELIFSTKRSEMNHPEIRFNNIPVMKVDEHKHLGIILDSKLSLSTHVKAAVCKARKGVDLLKYLSKCLPRNSLNELSKVCEFSGNTILPSLMEKLESVQYSAALAVTGTWRGRARIGVTEFPRVE